jgi:hypothetical protein
MVNRSEHGIQRRVTGDHDIRLDGIGDLLLRARGAKVLDVGCNRGMVGREFAVNGAVLVHGVDYYETGINTAREVFADIRNCSHRFEVLDLTKGVEAFHAMFAGQHYDIVLLLAITHKLRKVMPEAALAKVVEHFGAIADRYVGWRGSADELDFMDMRMKNAGLERVQWSIISETLVSPAAIWRRT